MQRVPEMNHLNLFPHSDFQPQAGETETLPKTTHAPMAKFGTIGRWDARRSHASVPLAVWPTLTNAPLRNDYSASSA